MKYEEVHIRPSAPDLIPSFRACLDAVARERVYLAMLTAPPLADVRDFVTSKLVDGMIQYYAVEGSRVVGWCDIIPRNDEGFRHSASLGMGLLPPYRGRGLGRRLIEHCLRDARQRTLERTELDVYDSNLPAIELYKKFDFEVEGRKRRARCIDDKYQDIVVMALLL